jgi:hypothetical protein
MNPDTNNANQEPNNQLPTQPITPVNSNQQAPQPIQLPVNTTPIDNSNQLTPPNNRRKRKILIIVLIAFIIILVLVGLSILGQHIINQTTHDTTAPLVKTTNVQDLAIIDTACYSVKLPKTYIQSSDLDPAKTCFIDTNETASKTSGVNNNETLVQNIGSARSEPSTLPTQQSGAITLDQAYDYLKTNFMPKVGTIKDAKVPITVGGVKAYRTTFKGRESKTLVVLTVVPPHPYIVFGKTVNFFVVSLSTSADNGEQILQTLVNNWQWK